MNDGRLGASGAQTMLGLMQDWPLTVDRIIDHAARWHGDAAVVGRAWDGSIERSSYAQVRANAARLSGALARRGVRPGDRVATLGWNTRRHLEAWYAVMGMGAVCHTLNPRLFDDQLRFIINEAADTVLFADRAFLPFLERCRADLASLERVILLDGEAAGADVAGLETMDALVAETGDTVSWGGFDERTAAALCYTSGTTGNPKGVLYSHRSQFLHSLAVINADIFRLSARDVVMPIVPMFHANAWGLPFAAPAVGAKLVMPGGRLDGLSVHELLESEGVTFAAAVPTVWQMLLQHLRETKGRLSSLERVVIGGSAVPPAMIEAFREEFGVDVIHAWGMTEMSPLGTAARPTSLTTQLPSADQAALATTQGRVSVIVDMKIADDQGVELPRDGIACGRLLVRGPAVAASYLGYDKTALDEEGWFDTGDIATIDRYGFMTVTDRAKDVVKSGGEWISSIAIETIVMGHPAVTTCAVIGVSHPKWDERPVLVVQPTSPDAVDGDALLAFLDGKIARWWMPDHVIFLEALPLGATGKVDKKQIRTTVEALGAGRMTGERV